MTAGAGTGSKADERRLERRPRSCARTKPLTQRGVGGAYLSEEGVDDVAAVGVSTVV